MEETRVNARRHILPFFLMATLLALLIGSAPAGAASTYTVRAGGGAPGTDILAFGPSTLRIHPGDAVTWTWTKVGTPHTVTFSPNGEPPALIVPVPDEPGSLMLNPRAAFPSEVPSTFDGQGFVNSGEITPGPQDPEKTFSLTFSTPGTYSYVCLFHPGMGGTVVVEPAEVPVPSPAEALAQGGAEFEALLAQGAELALDSRVTTETASSGPRTWQMAAGVGTTNVAVNQFLPDVVTVDAGDTIVWTLDHPTEPHTITFLGGQKPPEFVTPRIQTGAPPVLLLNPRFIMPSAMPGPTGSVRYEGGFLNSGMLNIGPGTPKQWAITFETPGTYQYLCLLHPGMLGVVSVREQDAWPPVVVDGDAVQSGDTVTFAFNIRNTSANRIEGVDIAVPIPEGATLADTTPVGRNVGSEVQWFGPDASIEPGASRGPFVLRVKLGEGQNPLDVKTHAWVSFDQPVNGTAVSDRISAGPPFATEGP